MSNDWKPIETAPKDGRPFLARFKESNLIPAGVTTVRWTEYPNSPECPPSQWELTHPGVHSEDDSTGNFEAWTEIPE